MSAMWCRPCAQTGTRRPAPGHRARPCDFDAETTTPATSHPQIARILNLPRGRPLTVFSYRTIFVPYRRIVAMRAGREPHTIKHFLLRSSSNPNNITSSNFCKLRLTLFYIQYSVPKVLIQVIFTYKLKTIISKLWRL